MSSRTAPSTLAPPPAVSASPPPFEALAQTTLSFSPDAEVTTANIDAAQRFLTQRGYFSANQPDELDEYFDLYVQVAGMRGEFASTGLKPAVAAPTSFPRKVAGAAPNMLTGRVRDSLIPIDDMEFHSTAGELMFKGREGDRSKNVARIPSFYLAAGRLNRAQVLSQRGNPYADLHLMMVWHFFEQQEKELLDYQATNEAALQKRGVQLGRTLRFTPNPNPSKPANRIMLASVYGSRLLHLLILFDRHAKELVQLHNQAILVPHAHMHQELQKLKENWRRLLHFIVEGWEGFLDRPDVREITRSNTVRGWPPGYDAFIRRHFMIGEIPVHVWEGRKSPGYTLAHW